MLDVKILIIKVHPELGKANKLVPKIEQITALYQKIIKSYPKLKRPTSIYRNKDSDPKATTTKMNTNINS